MNKIKETTIIDYGYDGEGVGRVDGKVCFVPFTIKGEDVTFEVTKNKKSFYQGRLKEVLKGSDLRIKPPCKYFGRCGGCRYQHLPYDEELKIKAELLKRQLGKVGFEGDIEVVPTELEYQYRNKIKLFVGEGKVGLKYLASNKICDVKECKICEDLICEAIKYISNFVKGNDLYKKIVNIILRQEGDGCLVNFIVNDYYEINYQGLQLLLGEKYGIYQTYQNISRHICGKEFLEASEFGLNCKYSPQSFHQVNGNVCQKMYSEVLGYVRGKTLNCYSGNGVLSGIIAKGINDKVVGIEIGKAEHQEAERLKEENKLYNLVNINGDCDEVVKNNKEKFNTIIVDPPRNGLSEVMCENLLNKSAQRLIYISCNSATLVRDLGRIKAYKIKKAYLFDMFARTGEYEVMVFLKKD